MHNYAPHNIHMDIKYKNRKEKNTKLSLITSSELRYYYTQMIYDNVLFCHRISLEVMTLNPICESVETSEGVPLTVTGVAQCKVMTEPELLATACEQFLGKSVEHIKSVILQTLEGHLRAILGKLARL